MQPIRTRLERYAASALIGSHTFLCGFFIYHIPDVRKMILSLIRNSIFACR